MQIINYFKHTVEREGSCCWITVADAKLFHVDVQIARKALLTHSFSKSL